MENRNEVPYIDNYGAKDKPDTLAPCIEIGEDKYGALATAGTSYAAPFVTTCIANTIQMLKRYETNPLPREVLAAIRRSSVEVSDCVYRAFNHRKFVQEIGSTYSIDLEIKNGTVLTFSILRISATDNDYGPHGVSPSQSKLWLALNR